MKIMSLFGSCNFQFPQKMWLNENFDKKWFAKHVPSEGIINTQQQQLWKWWMKRHGKLL